MKLTNIFVDCEWFLDQNLFLVGYAYSLKEYGQLYEKTLTVDHLEKILKPVDGYMFFYGPDVKMLEKFFNVNIRSHGRCVNLLRLFKVAMPNLSSYKLSSLEEKFGITRDTGEYKSNIFKLWHDWRNPYTKPLIMQYNMEDVLNLLRVKKIIFNKHSITNRDLDKHLLT